MFHSRALSSSSTPYLHWCYFWCDGKTARTFPSISLLPQAGQNRQRPGSRLGGIPLEGLWITRPNPRQKRCISLLCSALHSNVELHTAQIPSLRSSSSWATGSAWYKIASRPGDLCKQLHSSCNGQMQLFRHCPALLWFNCAAGSACITLDWRATAISWIWTVSC